jgi:PAS domain-containing protein
MAGRLELLQNVLNSLRLGIVVIDPDNRIVFFNREAGKMLNEEPHVSGVGSKAPQRPGGKP